MTFISNQKKLQTLLSVLTLNLNEPMGGVAKGIPKNAAISLPPLVAHHNPLSFPCCISIIGGVGGMFHPSTGSKQSNNESILKTVHVVSKVIVD